MKQKDEDDEGDLTSKIGEFFIHWNITTTDCDERSFFMSKNRYKRDERAEYLREQVSWRKKLRGRGKDTTGDSPSWEI